MSNSHLKFEQICAAVLQTGEPARLQFPSEDAAKKYRFSYFNWKRRDKKAFGDRWPGITFYIRDALVIIVRQDTAHLVPELASTLAPPVEVLIGDKALDDIEIDPTLRGEPPLSEADKFLAEAAKLIGEN